jgi:hypothetical protein
VIATNAPSSESVGVDSGGTRFYLDDIGSPAGNPFYDGLEGATANSTDFIDVPARPYSETTSWRAYLFIATGNLTGKQLSISNQGVYWGFDDPLIQATPTPAPSTMILLLPGAPALLLCLVQRRAGWGKGVLETLRTFAARRQA